MTGAVALNGAQIEFFTMTVSSRSVSLGKSTVTYFGFNEATHSASNVSKGNLEMGNGTIYDFDNLEDQGASINFGFDSGQTLTDSDAGGFRRLIIDDLSLNRSDRTAFAANNTWVWTSVDDALSSNNGQTIIIQLRAD